MKRYPFLLILLALVLATPPLARADTTLGSLDCDRADPYLWRDSAGSTFGQGNGQNYSFSANGRCYAHHSAGMASQPIRLATLTDAGPGIPISALNPEVTLELSTSVRPASVAGSAQYVYVLLRKRYASLYNNGREYRLRIGFTGNSSAGRNVRLKLSKVVSGVETGIGTEYVVPATVAYFEPNRVFHVRTSATGVSPTTLRAKIWTAGQSEPAGWQVEAQDGDPALQDQGQIQLLTKVTANNLDTPVDFAFDNLEFRDVN